jgi:exosortase
VNRRGLAAASVILIALAIAYSEVAAGLVRQWASDDNYSHGFVVVPLALWFAWERRDALGRAPLQPSWFGLIITAAGLGLLAVGVLGAELFLTRFSLIVVLAGLVLFLGGPAPLRVLAFPLAFLLLMIPIPAILFNKIAFPLQLLASRAGAATLDMAGVPVLREGNILVLATTKLEVVEACSGIRSLVTLLTLAIVLGQFSLGHAWSRIGLILAAIPVAIAANAARVAGTGLAAHFWSPEAAEGFFHAFSGWAMFGVAFAALLGVQRALTRVEEGATGWSTTNVHDEGSTQGFATKVQPKGSEI